MKQAIPGAAAIISLFLIATPAFGQSECTLNINGSPIAESSPERPIEISLEQSFPVSVTAADQAVAEASFSVLVGPASVPLWQTDSLALDPGQTATSSVDRPQDYAFLGVGAFEVVADADGCDAVTGWIVIVGRSPFATVAGWVATVVAAAGILLVALSLRSALAGRRRLRWAVIGGLSAGVGGMVLSQQFGMPITTQSMVAWTVAPTVLSGAAQGGLALVRGGQTVAGSAAGQPPPSTAAVGGVTLPSAAVSPEPDSREAYARLECPEAVVAEQDFDLLVGLSPTPDPGIVSEPMALPDWSTRDYQVSVQIIADRMSLAGEGQAWRVELPITAADPYPTRTLTLRAKAGSQPIIASSIRALYSVDGQPIGLAIRPVAIVRESAMLAGRAPTVTPAGVDLSLPSATTAPDLTVRIERAESESSGRFLLQMLTADPAIDLPDAPLSIDLGDDAAAFLLRVIQTMNAAEGNPGVYEALRGIGLTIAEQLPQEFWRVLQDVATQVDSRAPTVLLLSSEAYVPWALAVLDQPIDPNAPPFLGAQCDLGRWVLGQRRPKLPPPASLEVTAMAVVSGVYNQGSWQPLVEAEAEAHDLTEAYAAAAVNATTPDVLSLLAGKPPADVIHFAVHGNYDPEGGEDGLILTDGLALDPLKIKGTQSHGTPFVFLNACQVGAGQEVLGDYAGIAEAFLYAGAAGVIAPLWSIEDGLARTLASSFYTAAFGGGSPAAVLRRAHAEIQPGAAGTLSAGLFAYQYFGHPALQLSRQEG
jgi:hypothetical protein